VVGTDKLAQATWSRLGEVNRGSPKLIFHEWSPRRPAVLLSERVSCLGGEGLAWARSRRGYCSLCRALA